MRKIIISLFIITTCFSASAQMAQPDNMYYIDVLVDANKYIYFENQKVNLEEVAWKTKKIIYKLPFSEEKNITYRIFADGKLQLGYILDIKNQMYLGFSQPNLPTRKFLLETNQIPLDKSNWTKQLEKLNLKAIDGKDL